MRGEGLHHPLAYSEEEINTLRRFCTGVRQARALSLFHKNSPLWLEQQSNSDVPAYSIAPIDSEAWWAAMHIFRPLTLEEAKAKYTFYTVCRIISRIEGSEELKSTIRSLKRQFRGTTTIRVVPVAEGREKKISATGNQWNCNAGPEGPTDNIERKGFIATEDNLENIYKQWLHGYEHHDDSDKQARLEKLFPDGTTDHTKAILTVHMRRKLGVMEKLSKIIEDFFHTQGWSL